MIDVGQCMQETFATADDGSKVSVHNLYRSIIIYASSSIYGVLLCICLQNVGDFDVKGRGRWS